MGAAEVNVLRKGEKPMDKHQVLKHYFGHDEFRTGQEVLIDALHQGRDVLGVMPTGAGKSMCYQIPAVMTPGVTIVISPLISLMKDQVFALKSAGVPAAYLNSSLTPEQIDLAIARACQGMYRIIYVAPERLGTPSFQRLVRHVKIALLAVDEAHCVSQWGQDFRPEYLNIASFIASLPERPPVGAFTATATERVRADIIRLLELQNPVQTTTGFDRPNLYFEVIQPKSRIDTLKKILQGKRDQYGIVYCATRKTVMEVTEKLQDDGFSAAAYHAGLDDETRRRSQEDFQYDRVNVMVATNAFGMGIDKSNVQYVIHFNMPKSMEAYYQEAGRAGRDGENAECILLYSGQDIFTAKWMIEHGEPNDALTPDEREQVRKQDFRRLNDMIDYCQTEGCKRAFILRYFGEKGAQDCGDCSSCCGARYGQEALAAKGSTVKRTSLINNPTKPVPKPETLTPAQEAVFARLRECRILLAKQHHVPPYIICDDKTLRSMVQHMPKTKKDLLQVHGMGDVKVSRYGQAFLAAIAGGQVVQSTPDKVVARKVRPKPDAAGRPWSAEEDAKLRDMYLAGERIADLAVAFGRTTGVIRERLKHMGLIM